MRKAAVFLVLITGLIFLNGCAGKQLLLTHEITFDCKYYSLQSAQCLNKTQMLKQLEPYSVIFIGDHHSEDALHQNIASLITALAQSKITVKLANEWFYPEDDKILDAFSNGSIGEEEFLKQIEWKKRLKYYNYSSFKPIYEAVKSSNGQLYGINLSKQARKKISDQNLSAMDQNERVLNDGLDLNVTSHRNFIMPFFSHCHAPKPNESLEECRRRMYRVQVAWDTKMALESYKLSKQLNKNEKLIVLAGSIHIENKLGIPLRFARLGNVPTLSIIPVTKETKEVTNGVGDYLLFYQPKKD